MKVHQALETVLIKEAITKRDKYCPVEEIEVVQSVVRLLSDINSADTVEISQGARKLLDKDI